MTGELAILWDELKTLVAFREEMEDPDNWNDMGICDNVGEAVRTCTLRRCFRLWHKFSGSDVFPIEGSMEEYLLASGNPFDDEWVKHMRWGDYPTAHLRRELLDFVIETLQAELEQDHADN